MKNVFKIALMLMVFWSCKGSADSKVPELASEMCGCFESTQNQLSENAKKIMKEVALAENPKDVLMKGMQQLNPDEQKVFAEQLQSLANPNAPVMKCINAFDQKHAKETTKDKKALTQRLLKELQKNQGCYVSAAVVNLNPR